VTITSNCEKGTDFASFKTFTITHPKKANSMFPEYDNPANRSLIEEAITNELIQLGYSASKEKPDLLINYDIIITDKVDPRIDSAVIYKPWVDTRIDSFNYTEGLLVIRMIDQTKGMLVWQGSLSGILEKRPERFDNKLDKYINRLFFSLREQMQ